MRLPERTAPVVPPSLCRATLLIILVRGDATAVKPTQCMKRELVCCVTSPETKRREVALRKWRLNRRAFDCRSLMPRSPRWIVGRSYVPSVCSPHCGSEGAGLDMRSSGCTSSNSANMHPKMTGARGKSPNEAFAPNISDRSSTRTRPANLGRNSPTRCEPAHRTDGFVGRFPLDHLGEELEPLPEIPQLLRLE